MGAARDVLLHEQAHGLFHRSLPAQRVHVGLHDGREQRLAGALLVHRSLLAGLVLHKGDSHDQADEAEHRAHEEGGVDAQHGALGGAEARRGDVLHLGAHGDDDGGAERACHLAQRVVHGGAVVHDLVVQGVHAPGGDGHVHQRHREHAHRVHDGDVNDAGREVQNGEGEGGERQQTHAHDGHAAWAVAVEPLAGERIHDAHKDSAGHEHEARHRGRQPMERLHVNGHEDAGGQKRTLHEHADDGAHEEAAVLQHVDAQHRTRQTRLADEEPHNADDAERGGEQRHQREAGEPRAEKP